MALIQCQDCHKDISDSAAACPFCGRPRDKTEAEKTAEFFANRRKYGCPNCGSDEVGNIPIGLTFFGMRTKKCWKCGKTW
jgi:hypothetical protein